MLSAMGSWSAQVCLQGARANNKDKDRASIIRKYGRLIFLLGMYLFI